MVFTLDQFRKSNKALSYKIQSLKHEAEDAHEKNKVLLGMNKKLRDCLADILVNNDHILINKELMELDK